MIRISLVVGVGEFDSPSFSQLPGARLDADNIFSELTNAARGAYDQNLSSKILSPTLGELRQVLRNQQSTIEKADVFTLYFAGHGGVSGRTYYLCLKDTDPERLSTTALSLTELLQLINEARPRHTNIVLDSCESGGVASDLSVALRPEEVGSSRSGGISILSASASDRSSREDHLGGYISQYISSCLRGTTRIETDSPYISLSHICASIVAKQPQLAKDQHPIFWGLSLYGDARFALNPHYTSLEPSFSFNLSGIPPTSNFGQKIEQHADKIWKIYREAHHAFDARKLCDEVAAILNGPTTAASEYRDFSLGLAKTLAVRAASAANLFASPEIVATILVAQLSRSDSPEDINETILALATEFANENAKSIEALAVALKAERYSLLSKGGGISDFFVLPIRITKLLAWLSLHDRLVSRLGADQAKCQAISRTIGQTICDDYCASIVTVSDSQAAHFNELFSPGTDLFQTDLKELVFGRTVEDFFASRARIASSHITDDDVLQFILMRANGQYEGSRRILARPNHILPVLLRVSDHYKSADLVDYDLHLLDHVPMNVFVPNSFLAFWEQTVRSGQNHGFTIGHDVWSTQDFATHWQRICLPEIASAAANLRSGQLLAANLAALIFSDRIAWQNWLN